MNQKENKLLRKFIKQINLMWENKLLFDVSLLEIFSLYTFS